MSDQEINRCKFCNCALPPDKVFCGLCILDEATRQMEIMRNTKPDLTTNAKGGESISEPRDIGRERQATCSPNPAGETLEGQHPAQNIGHEICATCDRLLSVPSPTCSSGHPRPSAPCPRHSRIGVGTKLCEKHGVIQSKCGCNFNPPPCTCPQPSDPSAEKWEVEPNIFYSDDCWALNIVTKGKSFDILCPKPEFSTDQAKELATRIVDAMDFVAWVKRLIPLNGLSDPENLYGNMHILFGAHHDVVGYVKTNAIVHKENLALTKQLAEKDAELAALKAEIERLKKDFAVTCENLRRESQLACDLRTSQDETIERCAKSVQADYPDAAKLIRGHAEGISGEDNAELKRENERLVKELATYRDLSVTQNANLITAGHKVENLESMYSTARSIIARNLGDIGLAQLQKGEAR